VQLPAGYSFASDGGLIQIVKAQGYARDKKIPSGRSGHLAERTEQLSDHLTGMNPQSPTADGMSVSDSFFDGRYPEVDRISGSLIAQGLEPRHAEKILNLYHALNRQDHKKAYHGLSQGLSAANLVGRSLNRCPAYFFDMGAKGDKLAMLLAALFYRGDAIRATRDLFVNQDLFELQRSINIPNLVLLTVGYIGAASQSQSKNDEFRRQDELIRFATQTALFVDNDVEIAVNAVHARREEVLGMGLPLTIEQAILATTVLLGKYLVNPIIPIAFGDDYLEQQWYRNMVRHYNHLLSLAIQSISDRRLIPYIQVFGSDDSHPPVQSAHP
jgi:hypothetical protein